MASEYAAHSRSQGNDTSAETYGEPQTPAELPKSSTGLAAAKSQRDSLAVRRFVTFLASHHPHCVCSMRTDLQWHSRRNSAPARGGFAQQVLRGKRRWSEHEPTRGQTHSSRRQEAARCQPPLEVPLSLDPPTQQSATRTRCPQWRCYVAWRFLRA